MTDNSQEFNQRTVRAVIVCLLVVFVYTNLFLSPNKHPPAPVPQASQQVQQVAQAPQIGDRAPTTITVQPSGSVQASGLWKEGQLIKPYPLDTSLFPSNQYR